MASEWSRQRKTTLRCDWTQQVNDNASESHDNASDDPAVGELAIVDTPNSLAG